MTMSERLIPSLRTALPNITSGAPRLAPPYASLWSKKLTPAPWRVEIISSTAASSICAAAWSRRVSIRRSSARGNAEQGCGSPARCAGMGRRWLSGGWRMLRERC